MTRKIKFRAWDPELELMLPPVDLSLPLQHYKWLGRSDFPLMQFTGLHEKNGKEIYEGDIVQAWEPETETTTGKLQMIVDDVFSCYAPLRDKIIDKKDVEVIGNIYENPELLNN